MNMNSKFFPFPLHPAQLGYVNEAAVAAAVAKAGLGM